MNLTLLPLESSDIFRLRCEGPVSTRGLAAGTDPLQTLLGPRCYQHRILINLGDAPSIDTSGITWLTRTQKAFSQAGGTVVFHNVPPVILQMLDFLRLTSMLCIAVDEAGAKILASQDCQPQGEDGNEPVIRLPSAS